MTIYVVQGSTGEYSDHVEWLVKAFYQEKQAQDFVNELDKVADMINERIKKQGFIQYYSNKDNFNPLDPQFRVDYTGTNYTYYPVELL